MTRRERVLSGMGASGGTEAPGGRRSQIKQALGSNRPRGGAVIPKRLPPPKRFPQVGPQRPSQGTPLRPPMNVGGQLRGRVQSGAIDPMQAQQVSRQRQMLQKAFGSDWRSQVFGRGGAKGITGPFAERQVAAKRAQGLQRAKRKLY